jgi:hypothetical protein
MTNHQKRSSRPVESFGPKLMAALLIGATKGLSFKTTYAKAVRFRQRAYQLRAAMREAKHEKYSLVARIRISITWPMDTDLVPSGRHSIPDDRQSPVTLSISPNDSEFDDLLDGAGVSLPDISIDDMFAEPDGAPSPQGSDVLASLLKDMEPRKR